MIWTTDIPLVGGGGEPVDLKRTLMSHGVGDLPPSFIDEDRPALVTTIELAPGRARTITIERGSARTARVSVAGRRPSVADAAAVEAAVAHILRLDQDLSPFYEMVRLDPELSWVGRGAGRMTRSPTVFEDQDRVHDQLHLVRDRQDGHRPGRASRYPRSGSATRRPRGASLPLC